MDFAIYQYILLFITGIAGIVYVTHKRTNYLPDYISVSGPIILIHSRVGFSLVERIAQYKTTWRRLGSLGVLVCFLGMALALLGVGSSAVSLLLRPDAVQVTDPTNYLAIPGVNDFLPISVAFEIIIALLLGVVLHEGGHAILCRVEGIDLESTGLVFLSIIPMGAFVEPDEESKANASRIGRMRMASAGILQNLFITVGSMITIAIVVSLLLSPTAGAAVGSVYTGSPADSALDGGEVITTVNGEQINSNEDFEQYLSESTAQTLTIKTDAGKTVTMNRSVFILGSQSDELKPNDTIQSINGVQVNTMSEFSEVARETDISTISTESSTVTTPIGAKAVLQQNSQTQTVYITEVNGERVISSTEYTNALQENSTISYYIESTESETGFVKQQTTVTKSEVTQVAGYSGLVLDDTGIVQYPASQYLSILQFNNASSITGVLLGAFAWIVLPLGSVIPGLNFNFPGFTAENTAFYEVTIGSGTMIEPLLFFSLTVLFWLAWMNLNLALFNCLPIWSLDGHHVLRDGLHELRSRTESTVSQSVYTALSVLIPIVTVLTLLLVAAAPLLIQYL